MANTLTGENEAVVQISESTINRLMATLHQNAGTEKGLPSHPHNISVHITEDESVNGVFGWLVAQLGVPRVHLLHRATDRFELELHVRARFFPDDGSAHLPEFIHGVVRATYKVHPIDENCRGWRTRAEKYLWVRVVKNSVRFTGTATDDTPLLEDPATDTRIERLIADLLDNRFEAAPHELDAKYRPGRLISLKTADGDAIAVPINLPGGGSVYDIASIRNVFLDGHDFALAIGADWLSAQIEPLRTKVQRLSREFDVTTTVGIDVDVWFVDVDVDLVEITTHYRADVTSADLKWEDGFISVDIRGNVENLEMGVEVATFKVKDRIDVEFDAAAEEIRLVHNTTTAATIHYPFGFSLLAPSGAADKIATKVSNALKKLPTFSLSKYKIDLVGQLATLDDNLDARLEQAVINSDGIVVMGRIDVSKRTRPHVSFKKSDGELSLSAFPSWAPGGWIERFVWTWQSDFLPGESRTIRDRFVIASRATIQSRWGKSAVAVHDPQLPGLHGPGVVCLEIQGVQVDRRTGRLVKFKKKTCKTFGLALPVGVGAGDDRLLVKLKAGGSGEVGDIGLMELSTAQLDPSAANTLIVHSGGDYDPDTVSVIAAGLETSTRDDAGLRILYLMSEDAARRGGAELGATVAALSDDIGAHVELVEDVDHSWSRQLGIETESSAWRLITPNGGFTWEHDGRLEPGELGEALDDHLRASPPPNYQAIGTTISSTHAAPKLSLGRRPVTRRHNCPRALITPSAALISFLRGKSTASERQLAELVRIRSTNREASMGLIAVIDGDEELANALSERFDGVEVIADPSGVLAERFKVRIWPTTIGIDNGMVTGVREGLFDVTVKSANGSADDDDDDPSSPASEAT